MERAEAEVVVAGSGIGGAALALALGRAGRRVLLVEREVRPLLIPRPEILAEATIRILDCGLDAACVPLRAIRLHVGARRFVEIGERDLARAGAHPRSTDPEATRAGILSAASATGRVQIRRGIEVREVLAAAGRATGIRGAGPDGPFEARARIVVGDDGVKSAVRTSLGIPCAMEIFPMEFWGLRLPRPRELAPDIARGFVRPEGFRGGLTLGLFLPLPDGDFTAVLAAPVGAWEKRYADDKTAFVRDLEELTPLASFVREGLDDDPAHLFRIRRPWGHARAYQAPDRAEGAVLLGDAAHPMSPAGGQGANAAIHDAMELALRIDEALAGRAAPREAFFRYETRRRPANDASLLFTRRAAAGATRAIRFPLLGRLLPPAFALLDGSPAAKERLLRAVSTSFLGAD